MRVVWGIPRRVLGSRWVIPAAVLPTLMMVSMIIATTETARGDTVAGEVFLQGDFVEVGIHQAGSFGTVATAPSG